jgi:hypothetical protein
LLLYNVHRQYPADLRAAADTLTTRTSIQDAVVTGSPADSIPFTELYRGQADVVGLSAGTLGQDAEAVRALQQTADNYAKIWWLPGWASSTPSDIQNWLSQRAFVVETLFFPAQPGGSLGRTLALFYFPQDPLESRDVEAVFAGQIHLLRVEMEKSNPQAGQVLPVVLTWETEVPLSENYTVFVQLQDAAGNRITGSDGQPAMGMLPTSGWKTGQIVADRHALLLPNDLPAGAYKLVTGLYLAGTGQRLETAGGLDAVVIATFPANP